MAVVLKSIRKELVKKTAKRRFLRLAFKSWTPQLLKMRAKKRRAPVIREPPNTRLNQKFRHFVGCWASRMAVVFKSIRKELVKKTAKRRFLRLAFKSWTPQLLKMRAKKQRALAIREPPYTRSGPTSSHTLFKKDLGSSMKKASRSYQDINTCVPDLLLALLHILSIKYLHVQLFLMSNDLFGKFINTLNKENYYGTRELWIKQLPDFHKRNWFSNIKDYFTIVDKLVCAKVDYHHEIPQNHPIYRTLSKFRPSGDLRALGDIADPSVILVHRDVFNRCYKLCMPCIPLPVTDYNKRIFQLQCILLYDNDQAKPSFHHFSFDTLKKMDICLARYVNITQGQEYKLGDVPYLLSSNTKISIALVANLKMEPFFQRLRQQILPIFTYIKEDDSADPNRFINTCVLDSLLAALHIAYTGYPNIADLLNGDDFFRHVILLFQENRFREARRSCVAELGHGKVDLFGHVKEYIPLIVKLVWPENPPNDSEITRKLKEFGGVIVLGNPSDPPLILVHPAIYDGLSKELPHYFNDDEKKRMFALIFMLIGKDKHMTMCFPCAEESWLLYDNDPKKPPFQPFDINILKDYIIYLAGYVNVTQALEYKLGVAETGEVANLSNVAGEPFDPQLSALVAKMENLSLTNPVSETGEGVGTRPFVENVEMLSCSSCDSE